MRSPPLSVPHPFPVPSPSTCPSLPVPIHSSCPIPSPFALPLPHTAAPTHVCQVPTFAALPHTPTELAGVGVAAARSAGSERGGCAQHVQQGGAEAVAPGGNGSVSNAELSAAGAAESTPLVHGGAGAMPSEPSPRAAVSVAATVQLVCLIFGVTRNFLKFGFESAMVVVYDRQFFFSEGAAGVLAGTCALSTVLSLYLYRVLCVRRCSTSLLLYTAEGLGLTSAGLMAITGALADATSAVPLASAAGMTHADHPSLALPLSLTLAASLLFYPSMYLGAALGNSHPLQYAVAGHPFLSRAAMVAQQEILQTTVGKGLGMITARAALGDPPRISSLGVLFAAIMSAQAAVLWIGWDPLATARRLARLWR